MLFLPVTGDPIGPASNDKALTRSLERFESFKGRIEQMYNLSLPDPKLEDISSLKKFCSGLLLPSSGHLWSRPIKGLRLRDRLSIAGSLFLFRKVLPASTPSLSEFAKKIATPLPEPSDGFLSFCSRELERIFPLGWDKGYKSSVMGTCVRPSATLENSRRKGGGRGMLLLGFDSRAEFIQSALDKYKRNPSKRVSFVRASVVKTAGKDRIVTVNSVDMTYLTPYHQLMYDHISKQEWCLRGDARSTRFSDFFSVDGEVFVSGDYESATDNLNSTVQRHILNVINRRCSSVPLWIRDLASDTLRCVAKVGNKVVTVKRGQMMGNALSFPLLCLVNYLAFRYAVPRRSVPVKINGDDIVFRSTMDEFQNWSKSVKSSGLTLSLGKTSVSRNWFSLNSTFFVAGSKRVREAPVIRSTSLFTTPESLSEIKGRFDTTRRFGGRRRDLLQSWFLGRFRPQILKSQRSVTRGLEMIVSKRVLAQSQLLERESYYLSLDKQYDPPLDAKVGYFTNPVPPGWKRVRTNEKVDETEFFRELVELTWTPKISSSDEKVSWTSTWVKYPIKWGKLLGVSNRELKRRAIACTLPSKKEGEMRWVRTVGASKCESGDVGPSLGSGLEDASLSMDFDFNFAPACEGQRIIYS
nr:MAG: putative RNA-dependent RNA polymerase [Guiyang botourmia-like virus 1]